VGCARGSLLLLFILLQCYRDEPYIPMPLLSLPRLVRSLALVLVSFVRNHWAGGAVGRARGNLLFILLQCGHDHPYVLVPLLSLPRLMRSFALVLVSLVSILCLLLGQLPAMLFESVL